MRPHHVNPVQWSEAVGFARQSCARIFRNGGTPADALKAFAIVPIADADWTKAVDLIAEAMCTASRRAA
jgi:hypothetical protein